jgi:rhamnulokinase
VSHRHYIAIDLGAESGRIMRGTLGTGGRLELEEIHRFPNGPIKVLGTLRWDLLGLWREILAGLRKAGGAGFSPRSISVDSWGVDYVLTRGSEPALGCPFNYRDQRALGPYKRLREDPGESYLYAQTGIQFMPLNSVYQLVADLERDRGWVESSDGFLMIADWFHWLLTGRKTVEETNASTTQLFDPVKRAWARELIDRLGLPQGLFEIDTVKPGSIIGPLTEEAAEDSGLPKDTPVVACCTHDTGSAVVAVPASGEGWAYLSSGTWSLIGIERSEPLLTEEARTANFTNELGYGDTVRLLRNIIGLWLLQECRRQWARDGNEIEYAECTRLAAAATPQRSFILPDDPRFLAPTDMPARIREFCRETGQPEPGDAGAIARCIFESLALLYAVRLDELERLSGKPIHTLHIVGGGSRNLLLNQFAANATGRTVIAGPTEATAIGNVLVQALAMGDLADLQQARETVALSFAVEKYEPAEAGEWTAARRRFTELQTYFRAGERSGQPNQPEEEPGAQAAS